MGCNGSKQRDIEQSRQRIDRRPQQGDQSAAAAAAGGGQSTTITTAIGGIGTSSPAIGAGRGRDGGGDPSGDISASYTDMKIREKQMFQAIIERTQHDFIDISQSPGMIDFHSGVIESEYATRSAEEDLRNVELFGLPHINYAVRVTGKEGNLVPPPPSSPSSSSPDAAADHQGVESGVSGSGFDEESVEYIVSSRQGLSDSDMEMMDEVMENVTRGFSAIKVNGEGIGPLVVQLQLEM